MVDVVALYKRALEEFGERVRAVADDQWSLPTPNDDWDVRALVEHVMSEDLWLQPLIGGETVEAVGDRFEGDQLGDDPIAAWNAAAAAATAACEPDDVLDREVHVSFGVIPATDYLSQMATDHAIHAWDLARAIGGDERIDPDLIEFVIGYIAPQVEMWRAAGVLGPEVEVPDDIDPQSKLLALTGRDPAPSEGGEQAGKPTSHLDMLAAQARSIQAELDSYTTTRDHYWRTKAEDWTADLGRYDRVLVAMALILGHDVPPEPPFGAQRRLSREERAEMQELVEAQGIDIGRKA